MWAKLRGRKGYLQIALSLGIGLFLLTLVAAALHSGTIQDFGHCPAPAVQRAAAPEHFRLAVGFWTVLGSSGTVACRAGAKRRGGCRAGRALGAFSRQPRNAPGGGNGVLLRERVCPILAGAES